MGIPWDLMVIQGDLPSDFVNIAIEPGHLQRVFPIKNAFFHSYVSVAEGNFGTSMRIYGTCNIYGKMEHRFVELYMGMCQNLSIDHIRVGL